jgi:uncharacterized protein (TIGR02453 family)
MFDSDLPPFPGFRDEAFDFFRQLASHNERDWFKERKSVYEDEVVWPLQCLLVQASREAASHGLNLTADPKKSIFRIYRDTRFSNNKAPYKTHAGAVLTRDGSHATSGGLYIHIEPEQCMMASGWWHPENSVVRTWRNAMSLDPDAFLRVVERLSSAGLTLESDEKLKRLPAGYEHHGDEPIAAFLKYKSYIVSRQLSDNALKKPDFVTAVVQMMQDCHPLLTYGWALEKA